VKVRGKYEMAAENNFIDGWREGREIRMLFMDDGGADGDS
jgi:hypothetical protein